MRETILDNLNHPKQLEVLYRTDKSAFRKTFNELYQDIKGNAVAEVWHERLNFSPERDDSLGKSASKSLLFVIMLSLIATLIAKMPEIFGVNDEFFYPRNISFIVFPVLMVWFARISKPSHVTEGMVAFAIAASVLFINFLPDNVSSQTLILSCIHLPILLYSLTGLIFMGREWSSADSRIRFLKYSGDLLVMTGIILVSGAAMSAMTMRLFELIDIRIEDFYTRYVLAWGLASAPVVAAYIIEQNRLIVSKISPVIARIFSPMVLIIVLTYLTTIITTGKDPYNDREFLLVFNLLLIGVMAIILFSVAEAAKSRITRIEIGVLFLLSLATIIVNSIALSAIVFRISEWGFSPNKTAVLAGNLLILINLLLTAYKLAFAFRDPSELDSVKNLIASYLPVYAIWAAIVTFIFPLIFHFM